MTDIVERLRAYPEDWDGSVMSEAANEIERLRAELEGYRKNLCRHGVDRRVSACPSCYVRSEFQTGERNAV